MAIPLSVPASRSRPRCGEVKCLAFAFGKIPGSPTKGPAITVNNGIHSGPLTLPCSHSAPTTEVWLASQGAARRARFGGGVADRSRPASRQDRVGLNNRPGLRNLSDRLRILNNASIYSLLRFEASLLGEATASCPIIITGRQPKTENFRTLPSVPPTHSPKSLRSYGWGYDGQKMQHMPAHQAGRD